MSLGGRTSQCKETQLVQSRRHIYTLRQLGVPVKDRQESERLSQVFLNPCEDGRESCCLATYTPPVEPPMLVILEYWRPAHPFGLSVNVVDCS